MKSFFPVLVLILSLFAIGCDREDQSSDVIVPIEDVPSEQNPLLSRSGDGSLDFDCFTIDFPFAMIDEEGGVYDISSVEDFEALWQNETVWIVDFVYPLDITLEDGTAQTIVDSDGLFEAFALCIPEITIGEDQFPAYNVSEDNSCLTIQYPISLEALDGSTIEVADDEALNQAIAEDIYFFVFPFDVSVDNVEIITIDYSEDLFDALLDCNGDEWGGGFDGFGWDWDSGVEYIGCYTVEFPITLALIDGSEVTVDNHMELCDLMLEGQILDYTYPLVLNTEEGEEVIANSKEELDALIADCAWDDDVIIDWEYSEEVGILLPLLFGSIDSLDFTFEACYDITYPIMITNFEDVTTTIDEPLSFEELFATEEIFFSSVELPVTITFRASGEVVVIDSEEEFFEDVINNCD